jgi:hypothetical protein
LRHARSRRTPPLRAEQQGNPGNGGELGQTNDQAVQRRYPARKVSRQLIG